jgi:hypothetical protein
MKAADLLAADDLPIDVPLPDEQRPAAQMTNLMASSSSGARKPAYAISDTIVAASSRSPARRAGRA